MGSVSNLEGIAYMRLQSNIIKCFTDSGAIDSSAAKTLEELGITKIKNPEALETVQKMCEWKEIIQIDDRYWIDLTERNKYRWIPIFMLTIIIVISLGYCYYVFTTQF